MTKCEKGHRHRDARVWEYWGLSLIKFNSRVSLVFLKGHFDHSAPVSVRVRIPWRPCIPVANDGCVSEVSDGHKRLVDCHFVGSIEFRRWGTRVLSGWTIDRSLTLDNNQHIMFMELENITDEGTSQPPCCIRKIFRVHSSVYIWQIDSLLWLTIDWMPSWSVQRW